MAYRRIVVREVVRYESLPPERPRGVQRTYSMSLVGPHRVHEVTQTITQSGGRFFVDPGKFWMYGGRQGTFFKFPANVNGFVTFSAAEIAGIAWMLSCVFYMEMGFKCPSLAQLVEYCYSGQFQDRANHGSSMITRTATSSGTDRLGLANLCNYLRNVLEMQPVVILR